MAIKRNRNQLKRALLEAIDEGDANAVCQLLADDPSLLEAGNAHGNTPLLRAIDGGRLEMVACLLDLGAEPNRANHGGSSPLDSAAFGGLRDIAERLIDAGAEVNPLHAAGMGDLARLEACLRADRQALAPRTVGGRQVFAPLHVAVMAGQVEAVEWLLANGGDVEARSHNGHSPLALVAVCPDADNRAALAALLLSHGADPNAAAGHHWGRVLHEAIKIRDLGLVRQLLDRGADPNAQDASGKTAVHEAVAQNANAIVALLLDHAPDLTIETRKHVQQRGGETALDYARNRKRKAIARLLEEGTAA